MAASCNHVHAAHAAPMCALMSSLPGSWRLHTGQRTWLPLSGEGGRGAVAGSAGGRLRGGGGGGLLAAAGSGSRGAGGGCGAGC